MMSLFTLPTKWGTSLPPWSIALAALFFFVLVGICYYVEVGRSRAVKFLLALLRLCIVSLVLCVLCEPIYQNIEGKTHKSGVAVLVDASLSMDFEDEYKRESDEALLRFMGTADGKGRWKRADVCRHVLESSKTLPRLAQETELRFFRFGSQLTETTPKDRFEPSDRSTNIYDNLLSALEKTQSSLQEGRISGVFLLTDGRHNARSTHRWLDVIEYLQQRKIPAYPVGIGTPQKKKDVIVAGVSADQIALVGDTVDFKVKLKHTGYPGETIRIYLQDGDVPLTYDTVTLGPEGEIQETSLSCAFEREREYKITVVVPEQVDEFTTENNQRRTNLTVVPKRFKVLYLEELPRWEYRYLKSSLIRDRSILANMWLFSADRDFPQDKSREAASIQEVPKGEALFGYDCILLGDVSTEHLDPKMMENLIEFVEQKGGGLIFLSGPFHNPHQYWNTSLNKLLPVLVEGHEPSPANLARNITLTEIGKRHDIMKLSADRRENEELWEERFPGFYWYCPVTRARPGASTLAVYYDSERQIERPLFVTRMSGKGKTFFTALDSSCRWRYLYGDVYFDRFWGQVIRYTSMKKLLEQRRKYNLVVYNSYCSIDDPVEIELEVADSEVSPEDLPKSQKVFVQVEEGEKREIPLFYQSDSNSYKGILTPERRGLHKVTFTAEDGKESSETIQVITPEAEMQDTSLHLEELRRLADSTEGKYLEPQELENFWREGFSKLAEKRTTYENDYEEFPLWDRWWLLAALVFLFTVEWVVRKMSRML